MKKIKTSIKAGVTVNQKIVLGIMLASTTMLTFSFAGAMTNLPKQRAIDNIRITKPAPLVLRTITDARVNVNFSENEVAGGVNQAKASFFNNGIPLGELEMVDNFYTRSFGGDDNRQKPLALHLTHDESSVRLFPANIIAIEEEVSSNVYVKHTLCVPESIVHAAASNDLGELVYYYDTQGTPYRDKKLTQMAVPTTCPRLLANALNIKNIPVAIPNLPISWVIGPDGRPDVTASFIRNDVTMGMLGLNMPIYSPGILANIDGNDPLAVLVWHSDIDTAPHDLDSGVISIMDGTFSNDPQDLPEVDYSLCLPEISLGAWDKSLLFYDKYGTPYSDSLLLRPLLPKPCSSILAGALNPQNILHASINRTTDYWLAAHFLRAGGPRGELNVSTNEFTGRQIDNPGTSIVGYEDWGMDVIDPEEPRFLDPLMVTFYHDEADNRILPNSIINIFTTSTSSPDYSLCVPTSEIEALPNYNWTYYFYDRQGQPYRDNLLLDKVTCPATKSTRNNLIPTIGL